LPASAGIGSASHVSGELFEMMTGVNLVHVPYRGAGPASADRRLPDCHMAAASAAM
jgi:tripartite-type tricarboxylate transporter receptor subunit TctC